MKALMSVVVVLMVALCASAEMSPVRWTEVGGGAKGQWGVAANWQDADGNPCVPGVGDRTGAAATLDELKSDGTSAVRKTISTGERSEATAVNPSVGSLAGSSRYVIRHVEADADSYLQSLRNFMVGNPDGFLGYWETKAPLAQFELGATEGYTPKMSSLSAACRPGLKVAAGAAKLGTLYDHGALDKVGAGTLEIEATAGDGAVVYVNEGSVTLDGAATSVGAALAKAFLHLDASKDDTLVKNEGPWKDGVRTYVTSWRDVRKNGVCVRVPRVGEFGVTVNSPFLRESAVSPTGLPLVDFGACKLTSCEALDATNYTFLCVANENPDGGSTLYRVDEAYEAYYAVQFAEWNNVSVIGSYSGSIYPFHAGANGAPLCAYSDFGVRAGDLLANGRRVEWDYAPGLGVVTNFLVYSAASDVPFRMDSIATHQGSVGNSGGMRIGELLLFTNKLTRAERLAVHNYLNAKWRLGGKGSDAAALFASNDSSVGVPSDKVAQIGDVVATGGTLVKTGAGTLVTEGVSPTGASIDVRGGAVVFAKAEDFSDGPAAAPRMWFDASAAGTLTDAAVADESQAWVSFWKDCRDGNSQLATSAYEMVPRLPYKVSYAVPGTARTLTALNLGRNDLTDGTGTRCSAWIKLPNYGDGGPRDSSTYAAFIVLRANRLGSGVNFFAGNYNDITFLRNDKCLLCHTYRSVGASSGLWAINGVPVDPWTEQALLDQTNDFVVISASFANAVATMGIACDRGIEGNTGNITVGEVLIYNRDLGADDRRRTEAYLMKKWLNREHPVADVISVGTLGFADTAKVSVSSDRPLEVARLSGGNGTLEKDGAGNVTIRHAPASSVAAAVTVKSGRLNVTPAWDDEAVYHFDASDVSSMDYYVTVDGEGQSVTNVTHWYDARRIGPVARSCKDAKTSSLVARDPVLCTREIAPGVFRQVVDFGEKSTSSSLDDTTAAMRFDKTYTNVRTVISVVSDRSTSQGEIVGNVDESLSFLRGGSYPISTAYAAQDTRDGYFGLDGAKSSLWNTIDHTTIPCLNFAEAA